MRAPCNAAAAPHRERVGKRSEAPCVHRLVRRLALSWRCSRAPDRCLRRSPRRAPSTDSARAVSGSIARMTASAGASAATFLAAAKVAPEEIPQKMPSLLASARAASIASASVTVDDAIRHRRVQNRGYEVGRPALDLVRRERLTLQRSGRGCGSATMIFDLRARDFHHLRRRRSACRLCPSR